MAKLTKTFIDKVEPPASGYQIHWDDKLSGYGLRVTASGVRSFVAQGRVNGKATITTIGRYGLFTEDAARKKAIKVLQDMRDGINPRAANKAEAAMKVSLQDTLEAYVGRPGKLKDSTAREYRRHVEVTFSKWCALPIASITRDMVQDRHAALVKGGLDGKKGAPASANAAFVTLRILIRFAMDEYRQADGTPLIRDNPVDALKHHWAKLGTRTERYIDKRKIGEVWNKLHAMRGEVQGYEALASVDLTIFALLTGARRDEMATLLWSNVNIDDDDASNCWWRITDRKRGEDLQMPLSRQAVALLKSRPRLKREDGTESPFVFPSWGRTGRIMDARAPMEVITTIVGKRLSLHDARRSFTNYAMRECRIGKFETDLATGHAPSSDDITARAYLDLANLEWLLPEIQKVADWIEQQAAIAASKNVVQLQQRA